MNERLVLGGRRALVVGLALACLGSAGCGGFVRSVQGVAAQHYACSARRVTVRRVSGPHLRLSGCGPEREVVCWQDRRGMRCLDLSPMVARALADARDRRRDAFLAVAGSPGPFLAAPLGALPTSPPRAPPPHAPAPRGTPEAAPSSGARAAAVPPDPAEHLVRAALARQLTVPVRACVPPPTALTLSVELEAGGRVLGVGGLEGLPPDQQVCVVVAAERVAIDRATEPRTVQVRVR